MDNLEEYLHRDFSVGGFEADREVQNWIDKARNKNPDAEDVLFQLITGFVSRNTPGWPPALRKYLQDSLRDLYYGVDGHKAFYFHHKKKARGAPVDRIWQHTQAAEVLGELQNLQELFKNGQSQVNPTMAQACENAAENLKSGIVIENRYEPSGIKTKKVTNESTYRDSYKNTFGHPDNQGEAKGPQVWFDNNKHGLTERFEIKE